MATDFHSHILPSMDDDSPDVRIGIAMLEQERGYGNENAEGGSDPASGL